MAQKFGGSEIVSQKPVHLGSDQIQMQLAPSKDAGEAHITVHRDVAERMGGNGKVHGQFSNLGFETEFDRKKRLREATGLIEEGAAGPDTNP